MKKRLIADVAKSRVAVGVRQKYMGIMAQECMKIYDDEKDAYDRVSLGCDYVLAFQRPYPIFNLYILAGYRRGEDCVYA